jgi:hypothetical protein
MVFFRQRSPALLVLKLTKLETKFLGANLVFEFSHSQDPSRTLARILCCGSEACFHPGFVRGTVAPNFPIFRHRRKFRGAE